MKSCQLLVIGLVLAISLIFAGCTSPGPVNSPAVTTTAPQEKTMTMSPSNPGTAPTVTIMSPQDKATITGSNVTMTIQIANFAITPESTDMNSMQGVQNKAGMGHIHWFIDVPAPTDPGKKAETAAGTWKMHDDTSYTFPDVHPGTHTLSVELVNNDMTPLTQPVFQTITVTVQ